jgi:hypothetical protein
MTRTFLSGTASFGNLGFVTKGRVRAVPKPLAGVLAHRPMDVLRVLARLMLVKDIQKLAEHLSARVGRNGLGDRYEFHPRLAQLAGIKLGMERIPAETAQRMNNDEGERSFGQRRLVDHFLEDGPIVVEGGSSRFAVDLNDVPTLALAVSATLGNLIRKRKVAFGLPRRRDARVNCGASHG